MEQVNERRRILDLDLQKARYELCWPNAVTPRATLTTG